MSQMKQAAAMLRNDRLVTQGLHAVVLVGSPADSQWQDPSLPLVQYARMFTPNGRVFRLLCEPERYRNGALVT